MPMSDPHDDPEGAAADAIIAEAERLRALMAPTPPAPATVTLPAPPPGSKYVLTFVGGRVGRLARELARLPTVITWGSSSPGRS